MSDVQSTAVLAESTVQKVAAGEVEEHRRTRGPDQRPRQSAPRKLLLHEDLVGLIRDLGTPISHVQVLGINGIIIWNHAAPWPELAAPDPSP